VVEAHPAAPSESPQTVGFLGSLGSRRSASNRLRALGQRSDHGRTRSENSARTVGQGPGTVRSRSENGPRRVGSESPRGPVRGVVGGNDVVARIRRRGSMWLDAGGSGSIRLDASERVRMPVPSASALTGRAAPLVPVENRDPRIGEVRDYEGEKAPSITTGTVWSPSSSDATSTSPP